MGSANVRVEFQLAWIDGAVIATSAGPGGGPHVRIFNPDGQERIGFFAYDPTFTGGVRVALGDVNRDGFPDVVTAPGPGGGPHIRVLDGRTGEFLPAPLGSFFAYDSAFRGGVNLAVGDVNHDGFDDIITGADAGGGPHVKVFSGLDGSEIQSFFAYDASFTGGVRVAAGDVNGDGFADIITGAGAGGGPHVRVFSGSNVAVLNEFMAYGSDFIGGVYVAAGDLDGDNKADVITGAGAGGGPHVRTFQALTAQEISGFFAFDPAFTGGVRVGVTDDNGDARAEIVAAAGPGGGPHVKVFTTAGTMRSSFFAYDPSFTGGVFVGGSVAAVGGSFVSADLSTGPSSTASASGVAPTFTTPSSARPTSAAVPQTAPINSSSRAHQDALASWNNADSSANQSADSLADSLAVRQAADPAELVGALLDEGIALVV